MHDPAETIEGPHDSEKSLGHARLFRGDGVSVPQHWYDVREAEGDVHESREQIQEVRVVVHGDCLQLRRRTEGGGEHRYL